MSKSTRFDYAMKGNNGKAFKKQQARAIFMLIGFCALIAYSYYISQLNHKVVVAHGHNSQRNQSNEDFKLKTIDQAARGEVHLIDIYPGRSDSHGSKYDNFFGKFCTLNWESYKNDPTLAPMFRHLVKNSRGCSSAITLKLSDVVSAAKSIDSGNHDGEDSTSHVHSIPPSGFVFQESRCGSTLVANSLAVVNPESHRVYSESSPLISAMKYTAEDVSLEAKKFVQDVVYLMGRTNDPKETKLFYKIQSIGTTYIRSLRQAFPETPWIFVYRDPVQVMMSHMPQDVTSAVCLRSRRNPPPNLRNLVTKINGKSYHDLSNFESCAAHLSYLCQSILDEHEATQTGRMVNYKHLPDILLDEIFPNYFGIPVAESERSRVISSSMKYSKGAMQSTTWKDDSKEKEKNASPALKAAADEYMYGIFNKLESIASEQ